MIVDHTCRAYKAKWYAAGCNRYNGAYYYSREIVKNIIPYVFTDRNWVTINVPHHAHNHSIVFIHNNVRPELYDWLSDYNDLILVCGVPSTCDKVKHLGIPIYLPLSVDVMDVQNFRREKMRDTAFVGRPAKRRDIVLPEGVEYIEGLPREDLLKQMALYRNVYAVGRTAIEAKVLGCNVLPYDPRFPDPSVWKVMDNRGAVKILQKSLNEVERQIKHERDKGY